MSEGEQPKYRYQRPNLDSLDGPIRRAGTTLPPKSEGEGTTIPGGVVLLAFVLLFVLIVGAFFAAAVQSGIEAPAKEKCIGTCTSRCPEGYSASYGSGACSCQCVATKCGVGV